MMQIPNKNSFAFLRTIFCLFVIFDHTMIITGLGNGTTVSNKIAVPVFFILSVFWVTLSCLRSENALVYFKKRLAKIFPQYLLVVFISAFAFSLLSSLSFKEYFTHRLFFKYLIANISTLGFICNNLPGLDFPYGVNGALWTIKIEIGFYLTLPFLLRIIKKLEEKSAASFENMRMKQMYSGIIIGVLYVLSIGCTILLSALINKFNLSQSINNQLPSLFCYFAAGMLCYFYIEELLKYGKYFVFPCLILVILYSIFNWQFLLPIFPISLAILIIYIGFRFPIFSGFKDYSYGMYLVHFPLINALTFTNIFSNPLIGFLLVVLLSFILTYGIGKLFSIKLNKKEV